jgi:hypothetical protein
MKSSSAQAPRLRLLILSCPLMADFVAKVVDGFCEVIPSLYYDSRRGNSMHGYEPTREAAMAALQELAAGIKSRTASCRAPHWPKTRTPPERALGQRRGLGNPHQW